MNNKNKNREKFLSGEVFMIPGEYYSEQYKFKTNLDLNKSSTDGYICIKRNCDDEFTYYCNAQDCVHFINCKTYFFDLGLSHQLMYGYLLFVKEETEVTNG